jgi:hypothetical protein
VRGRSQATRSKRQQGEQAPAMGAPLSVGRLAPGRE